MAPRDPKIILSYRRADTSGIAGRIYDTLMRRYGQRNVFMDVDSIPAGVDFHDHIQRALRDAQVLLLIIGRDWIGRREGRDPRISDPGDYVRLEIEQALSEGIPVIPLLVDGAEMPLREELPETVHNLLRINALEINGGRDFHVHAGRLIDDIDVLVRLTNPKGSGADDKGELGPLDEPPSEAPKKARRLSFYLIPLAAVALTTAVAALLWVSPFSGNAVGEGEIVITDRLGRRQESQSIRIFLDGTLAGELHLDGSNPTSRVSFPGTGQEAAYLLLGHDIRVVDGERRRNAIRGEGMIMLEPGARFCIRGNPAPSDPSRIVARLAPLRECG